MQQLQWRFHCLRPDAAHQQGISSQKLCATPEGIMDQEGAFLQLMGQANSMAIGAGQLAVFDGAGNRILVFLNG